jgi:hypothetical protein
MMYPVVMRYTVPMIAGEHVRPTSEFPTGEAGGYPGLARMRNED